MLIRDNTTDVIFDLQDYEYSYILPSLRNQVESEITPYIGSLEFEPTVLGGIDVLKVVWVGK